jgi:hypothetical protein
MNGRSQMQGGKNWILRERDECNRFFRGSHWLEIWKNHLCLSMGPNGGSVAMDSGEQIYGQKWTYVFQDGKLSYLLKCKHYCF